MRVLGYTDAEIRGLFAGNEALLDATFEEDATTGASVEEVALSLAGRIVEHGADLLTLVGGEDLGREDLEELAEAIRDLDEDIEVETRDGGQPLYPLQMVAE